MGIKRLSNQKVQNRIPTADRVFFNSIPCKGLCTNKGSNPPFARREKIVNPCGKATCNGQIARFIPSDPSTLCHNAAEMINMTHPAFETLLPYESTPPSDTDCVY